jgi:hypothetical protein
MEKKKGVRYLDRGSGLGVLLIEKSGNAQQHSDVGNRIGAARERLAQILMSHPEWNSNDPAINHNVHKDKKTNGAACRRRTMGPDGSNRR